MKKHSKFASALLAASLMASPLVFAEPTPPLPAMHSQPAMSHGPNHFIEQLKLSPAQRAVYDQGHKNLRQEQLQFNKNIKAAKRSLQAVINQQMQSDNPSLEAVIAQQKKFRQAMEHFFTLRERQQLQFFNQLDAKQKQMYLKHMHHMAAKRMQGRALRAKHKPMPPRPVGKTEKLLPPPA